MKISDQIHTLVRSKGVKMADLAEELGMSRQNLYNIMRANRFNSSQITRMAHYFGVPENYFKKESYLDIMTYQIDQAQASDQIFSTPIKSLFGEHSECSKEINYLKKIIKEQEKQILLLNKLLKILETPEN
ncbi:MAG: helix-turn-helix domain-containing protein [Lentimicrobium sp.]|nr:helix-turn-helix domain-containing protein [Lentimicrobium sp.]